MTHGIYRLKGDTPEKDRVVVKYDDGNEMEVSISRYKEKGYARAFE
ncbi:hypothetical protein [Methylobacterium iners]|uniref:Uncharacterized protein n=1 Tax=Methylobacterium iners TaxID=418707 RepID=A0ABQ4RYC1_9HYPH|nr:hypothetical protein [Methylobacterium iners]GJD95840.1 hypothetical protein OCOJLMKI_3056 [Methylobacterium iners]